jgi:hypothetical protein
MGQLSKVTLSLHAALLPTALWARCGLSLQGLAAVVRPRWHRNLLLLFLVGTVLVNVEGRRVSRFIEAEEPLPYAGARRVYQLRQIFNLQARWRMYAPSPPAYTGWWVCVGGTRMGAEVDPITGSKPTCIPPDNAAWPFGGLGSVYWFYDPDEESYVQEEFAYFLQWQDERYTPEDERLTHFSLFYVYVPYEPMPMLVMRWPEQQDGHAPPSLRADSLLHEATVYKLAYEGWGEMLSK